jgi:Seryl-tRNA synthetase
MLDPNLIRTQPEFVKEGIKNKGSDPALVDKFLEIDKVRRELIKEIDELRHQRRELSESIGKSKKWRTRRRYSRRSPSFR